MVATLEHPKTTNLENQVNAPLTQMDSSGGKLPPPLRPTYQGPSDDDRLGYTVPLVLGTYTQAPSLQQDYSSTSPSQGKDSRPYDRRN